MLVDWSSLVNFPEILLIAFLPIFFSKKLYTLGTVTASKIVNFANTLKTDFLIIFFQQKNSNMLKNIFIEKGDRKS